MNRKDRETLFFLSSLFILASQTSCGVTDSATFGTAGIPVGTGGNYSPQPQDPNPTPNPDLGNGKKRRALIIGLDGMTGNQFHEATYIKNDARNFLSLMLAGKFSICTQDTDPRCARAHQGRRF